MGPMRLWIISDLHLEFGPLTLPEVQADVVVLAGDVHVGTKGLDWCRKQFPEMPVIYVPGNHEYYGAAIPKLTEKLRQEAAGSQVFILDDEGLEIGGVTFLGTTLWTDFRLQGDPLVSSREADAVMNDYRRIRVSPSYRRLRPADTLARHQKSRRWLMLQLAERAPGPVVVVTHHAPSALSYGNHQSLDLVSAAFASRLDDLVVRSRAALWVHGHIHQAADYCLGDTRVLCNPRGYPDEPVFGFDPALVVEI
jgi:Icc-related predicted phosphoesterase